MISDPIARGRAASLLRGTRFRVYRTEHLPPLGDGWSPWDEVVGDASFVELERDGAAPAVFEAAREMAMTRLLEVREWNGAGAHHVAVLPINGSFTLVFAVVTPNGPVFTVSPVAIASLRRDAIPGCGGGPEATN